MFLNNKIKLFNVIRKVLPALLLLASTTAWAAQPPKPSSLNNPLALTLVTLMVVLLIVIFMLGKLLTDIAEVKLKKDKEKKSGATTAIVPAILLLLFAGHAGIAQETAASQVIGGLSAFIFYVMIGIIFIEMLVILALLINIRFLLKKDDPKAFEGAYEFKPKKFTAWWSKMNRFKPVGQEAEIELDHDYDGIKELDNKLPPWWLYGFYVSILFGVFYLWRYHVAYSAPLSKEEFEISIKKADEEVKAYLAAQGESVDENTVTVLTDAADLAAGKNIYVAACVACHREDGGGLVGPNLTDDYWMHGGDIKSIFKTVKYGINAMPPWQASYSNKQLAQVASYVKALHGTHPADAKAQEGELYKEEAATEE